MSKLSARFGWLALAVLVAFVGCSSKQEEVAIAPTPAAPPAAPVEDNYDGGSDDGSSSDSSDDGSSADDGSGDDGSMAADDGSTDDGSSADGSADDGSMAADDGSMSDDDGSGMVAVPVKPKNLREQAEQAFNDGYEKAAYRLIQGHVLASTSDASELLGNYRWSPSRKQPQLGVRIAVGVELTSSTSSELKDYKPVGSLHGFFSSRKTTSRRRLPGIEVDELVEQPSGQSSSANLRPTNNKERVLQKYAGLMGDVLVDHIKSSHAEGKWSPVFQTLSGVASTAPQYASGDGSDDDGSGGGYDDSEGMSIMNAGKVELATKIVGDEAKYISVGPILTYIGKGTQAELIELAKTGEFDALLVFDVDISVNMKLRMIYNECRAKLLNLADGKILAASKLLKNTDAQKEIDKSGLDYVVTSMQPILAKLDETVAIKDIPPALTPEIIRSKRMETLLSGSRSKLDSLVEIRLYREKSLLEDKDVNAAFETILGAEDGKVLLNGTDEERLAIVKKLLAAT